MAVRRVVDSLFFATSLLPSRMVQLLEGVVVVGALEDHLQCHVTGLLSH